MVKHTELAPGMRVRIKECGSEKWEIGTVMHIRAADNSLVIRLDSGRHQVLTNNMSCKVEDTTQ